MNHFSIADNSRFDAHPLLRWHLRGGGQSGLATKHCSRRFIVHLQISSIMIVTIPSSSTHGGFGLVTLEISDNCPTCGEKRGEIFATHSYDGSRRLNCDGWNNPCGHIDKYSDIRQEGKRVPYKEPHEFAHVQNWYFCFSHCRERPHGLCSRD